MAWSDGWWWNGAYALGNYIFGNAHLMEAIDQAFRGPASGSNAAFTGQQYPLIRPCESARRTVANFDARLPWANILMNHT
jgi:hypothetical protein